MIIPSNPLRARRAWKKRLQLEYDDEGTIVIKRDSDAQESTPTTTAPPPRPPPPPPPPPPGGGSSPGFFNSGPGGPPPPPRSSSGSNQPCLSPGGTLTYTNSNGTVQNYTNLGGNCLGLDVGESGSQNGSINGISLHDPFFASVTPQTFALAGATIAAAILLVLLFLSRTRKPWIQKTATFAMTVSLVTYMVVSVNMLEDQYAQGRYDADALRNVNQNLVCQIFAYIAELIIYLAQVQTLMKIFPRKRDKVIIKWTGLCLIVLTMIFTALMQFLQPSAPPPGQRSSAWQIFMQILPPLNYLFSIALALIYALCVIYFGIIHRRVAYTIPAGFILALLSLACITIPIVFFCLDIWAEFVVGWGQYIRSIASIGSVVIVWEWIERVDESEAKRDGKSAVLGRRIFEDEFDVSARSKTPRSGSSESLFLGWGKKMGLPSIFSSISDKASGWSLKLQSRLDRRASTPTTPAVTAIALSDLNSCISPRQPGSISSPSTADDTRTAATSTTGDDAYASTSYTGTSGASSFSPLVGGRPPKKKHHYPIARSANRTRQLTQTPSISTQSPPIPEVRESVFDPSPSIEPSAPSLHASDNESIHDRPTSSNAPSFHSRESEDRRARARFSVLPGFSTEDYFIDPAELEKRGFADNGRTSG